MGPGGDAVRGCHLEMPQRTNVPLRLRESLWQRGECEKAISHMAEAARLSGHDPERLVRLGQMYLARGDLAGAARQADVAIAANPQLVQHGHCVARCCRRKAIAARPWRVTTAR